MIAIVTGANGFIGQRLTEMLLQEGFHIRCVDIRPPRPEIKKDARVEHYVIDCADSQCLEKSGILNGADYVFHLAAVTKGADYETFYKGNVLPTKSLLQALLDSKIRLHRFVFVSTQAAAGPARDLTHPIAESDEPHPNEDYSATKLEAENVVRQFGKKIPFTIIRPSCVYGPGDIDFLNIFKQIKFHVNVYPGYRKKWISIIYVDDLARGIVCAVRNEATIGKTYFLGNEAPVTWQEVHRTMAKAANKKVMEISLPWWFVAMVCRGGDLWTHLTGHYTIANSRKAILSKQPFWICSAKSAFHDFGFQTKTTLIDGLKQTFEWYVQNDWL